MVEPVAVVDAYNLKITNSELLNIVGYVKLDEHCGDFFNSGYVGCVENGYQERFDLLLVATVDEAIKETCCFMAAMESYWS